MSTGNSARTCDSRVSPPTVLFIANVAWFFVSHRLPLALAAIRNGWRVVVATDIENESERQLLLEHGIEFFRLRISRSGINPFREIGSVFHIIYLIGHVRPDIVHNVTAKPVVYGTLAARLFANVAVVNAISGLGYAFIDGRNRRAIRSIMMIAYRLLFKGPEVKVIVQNCDDKAFLIKAGLVRESQAHLIRGSGVDLVEFAEQPERDGIPVVLLLARMLRDKGVIEFAQACKILLERGIRAEFVLAGRVDLGNPAGLSETELHDLEKDFGVRWVGHQSDVTHLIGGSHIVCLPSYREGLPKTLIEACAIGRAIVAADVPGIREIVVPAVNGLLVPPRNSEDLAKAIGFLLANKTKRQAMGSAGRKIAEAGFGVEVVVQQTFGVYREASKKFAINANSPAE